MTDLTNGLGLPRLIVRSTPGELADEWVQTWKTLAMEVRAQGKNFCVALAGGSTPKQFYEALAHASFAEDFQWDHVHLFWGDERCVPPGHPDSNYGMAQEVLLTQISIPEKNIHRMRGESIPEEAARRYAEELRQTLESKNNVPQFDWIVLGMGTDGHTASLFPGQEAVWDTADLCAVASHPESEQRRVTFTLRLLRNAKKVSFLVTGSDKADMVAKVLQDPDSRQRYPAAMLCGGNVEWWLDREAASQLKSV